jgi:hypothetical protein
LVPVSLDHLAQALAEAFTLADRRSAAPAGQACQGCQAWPWAFIAGSTSLTSTLCDINTWVEAIR